MNTHYIRKPDHFSLNCFARSKFCQIFYWSGDSIPYINKQWRHNEKGQLFQGWIQKFWRGGGGTQTKNMTQKYWKEGGHKSKHFLKSKILKNFLKREGHRSPGPCVSDTIEHVDEVMTRSFIAIFHIIVSVPNLCEQTPSLFIAENNTI